MNRSVKVLSIITVVSIVLVMVLFFIALEDYNYNILATLKYFWIMLFFPIGFAALLIREKRISESPIKEIRAEVVNKQTEYNNLKNRHIFMVSFKTHNGLLWTFATPTEIFNKVMVGQQGVLSYRERKARVYFVYFTCLDNVDGIGDGPGC